MNELTAILDDTVERLFGDRVSAEVLAAAEAGEWQAALWQAIEDAGLARPLVAEAAGGAGANWQDAWPILRGCGRHALPLPLAETILAGFLAAEAGLDVPAGPLTVADGATLTTSGTPERLTGTIDAVPWGGDAGHIAVVATDAAATSVALVARGDVSVARDRNIGRDPRDAVTFADSPVLAAGTLDARHGDDPLRRWGALVRAAQIAGAIGRALELAVAYAGERVQFGRPIGKFQAIQQQLAEFAGDAAAAEMAARHACRAADRAADPAPEIAAAKIRTGDAVSVATRVAHQVHGAIGFTDEHRLHYATRRLWAWRGEYGSGAEWAAWLGRRVAARGADNLWHDLTQPLELRQA